MKSKNKMSNLGAREASLRHAYCILVHNEPEILRTLVRMIDDERNDIFIHIDAKSDMAQFADIKTAKSKLVWTPRVKTYWGGPSQIKAEITALKRAFDFGKYSRFHLLSGVDLPIKSQDYIHEFCDVKYADKEFIGFDLKSASNSLLLDQYRYYIVLDDYNRSTSLLVRKACSLIRRSFIACQRLTGFERRPPFVVKKGTNWVSLTSGMVNWLLNDDGASVYNFLLHAHCADEKLMQTVAWNSPFRDCIYNLDDEMTGCMREIDWNRGNPYVWKSADLPKLKESPCLFARKFGSNDLDIVRAIERMVSA